MSSLKAGCGGRQAAMICGAASALMLRPPLKRTIRVVKHQRAPPPPRKPRLSRPASPRCGGEVLHSSDQDAGTTTTTTTTTALVASNSSNAETVIMLMVCNKKCRFEDSLREHETH